MFRTKLLSLSAVVALASACGGPISAISTEEHTFANVGSSPRVVVVSHNGRINVRTSTDGQVTARVDKEGHGWSHDEAEDNLRDINVSFDEDGNTYRVDVSSGGHSDNWDHDTGAEVTLTVPKGTALDLTTDNGEIQSTGTTAPITARTSNGAINIDGGQGAMDLRTSNGTITATPFAAAFANLVTSNGKIEFSGPLTNGMNNFETSNGKITIGLPFSSQFEFDADTSNGDVTCEFSYSTVGRSSDSSLHGTVGGDTSVQIRAKSSNGNVRIEKL